MIVGAFVLPETRRGMIEASTTRKPSIPCTRSCGSTTAIASTPIFHAFGEAPAQLNTWIAYHPFAWLPGVLVATALAGHLVLWRRLAAKD